jgi:hypothetical protein
MGRFDEFEHAYCIDTIAAGSQGSFSSVWVSPTQELKNNLLNSLCHEELIHLRFVSWAS